MDINYKESPRKDGKKKKEFRCQICDQVCSSKSAYVDHVMTHTQSFDSEEEEDNTETIPEVVQSPNEEQNEEIAQPIEEKEKEIEENHIFPKIIYKIVEDDMEDEEGDDKDPLSVPETIQNESLNEPKFVLKRKFRNTSNLYCDKCGKYFQTFSHFQIHVETKCGSCKRIECSDCGAKFMSTNTLKLHQLIHKGEKKFKCEFCEKRFLSKGQLKVHERVHTNEKPFKCSECNKGFKHRESLVTHSSVHTGIKPYVCQNCNNRFSCIGNLIKHRKARPATCGLPEFCTNVKAAPRASTKFPGTLTIKEKDMYMGISLDNIKEQLFEESVVLSAGVNCKDIETKKVVEKEEEENAEVPETLEPLTEVSQENREVKELWEVLEGDPTTNLNECNEKSPIEEDYPSIFTIENEESQNPSEDAELVEVLKLDEHGKLHGTELIRMDTFLLMKSKVLEVVVPDKPPEDDITDETGILELEHNQNSISSSLNFDIEDYVEDANDDMVDNSLLDLESQNKEDIPSFNFKKLLTNPTQFKCDHCPKWYYNQQKRDEHQLLHGPGGSAEVPCQYCDLFFETEEEMEHHRTVNHIDLMQHKEILQCKICKKNFNELDMLFQHMAAVHPGKKESKPGKKNRNTCPNCKKSFIFAPMLNEHKKTCCKDKNLFVCPICQKHYANSSTLKTHMTCHNDLRPFGCTYCEKTFRTRSQVKVHERVHTGIKPYACDLCDKTFAHRESLLTHKSVHTGVKRFICIACGVRFSCISNLQAHRRTRKGSCGLFPVVTKAVSEFEEQSTT